MSDAGSATALRPETGCAVILGSGSRFRRQMLQAAGVVFSVVPADVDEPAARGRMAHDTPSITPDEIALRLAELKALQVSARHPQALVIGADQVLALDGTIFGKPDRIDAARDQLRALRGRTHTLPTAVVLAVDGRIVWRHVSVATLDMRDFSESFLDAYLSAAGDVVTETVGGYQLEGLGAQLFSRIEGDYFTVIGLPLIALLGELRARGVMLG